MEFLTGNIFSKIFCTFPVLLESVDLFNKSDISNRESMVVTKGAVLTEVSQSLLWKWNLVMGKLKFHALVGESCVYRKGNVWILLYVDDVIQLGPEEKNSIKMKPVVFTYVPFVNVCVLPAHCT